MPKINPCPRCKSKMNLRNTDMKCGEFSFLMLSCSNDSCFWNMTIPYDDKAGVSEIKSRIRLIEQWNEGTKPA